MDETVKAWKDVGVGAKSVERKGGREGGREVGREGGREGGR